MNGLNYFKSRFLKPHSERKRPQRDPSRSPNTRGIHNDDNHIVCTSSLPTNPHRFKRNHLYNDENGSTVRNGGPPMGKENELPSSPSRKRSVPNATAHKTFSSIEEEDPLEFLQVQSAAQWKALSGRIRWIEGGEQENEEQQISADKFNQEEWVGSPSKKRNIHKVKSPSPKLQNRDTYTVRIKPSEINPEGFSPTKVASLRLVCWRTKPWGNKSNAGRPVSGRRLFSSQFAVQWNVDCDEVYPSLFIGDKNSASNLGFLKKLGITHILNTAEGDEEGLVNLSQNHYEGTNVIYKGFPLWDCPNCNILPYLGPAADFIKGSIQSGGKCLVNCQMGVSRSATCALSYLMIHEDMTASQALYEFRSRRDVRPNDGFLEIIANLDNDLRRERELGESRSIQLASLSSVLPTCQNTEFWVDLKEVTEDDVGGQLISLFEDSVRKKLPGFSSKTSKSSTPRRWSRSLSGKSSLKNSRTVSRNSSFYDKNRKTPNICVTPPEKTYSADGEDNFENGWEWVWEYEEEDNEEDRPNLIGESSPLTTRKLEKVKDIIEKPEERWRILWDKKNMMETPSPIGSLYSRCSSINKNLIQPKADESEILESLLVQVDSAKKWKSISQKLSINFDDINISEPQVQEKPPIAAEDPLQERPQTPSDFKPTLSKQLRILCWKIKPWDQPKERNLFTSIMGSGWGVDCDEVYPRIFLGDEAAARNLAFLKKIKITHVLNTAQGEWTDHSFVNLNQDYYEGTGITYQGFELWDHPGVNIERYFGPANEFISSCIEEGGRVLIHCQMGVSRSCVCAMTYLMLTKGFSAVETLKIFRSRRDVHPNDHFLSQVAELDNELRKERDYQIPSQIKMYSLDDVKNFPKPYHYEFWDTVPENESLPFTLRRKDEPNGDAQSQVSDKISVKEEESPSSSEWEYYTETEDELSENEEEL